MRRAFTILMIATGLCLPITRKGVAAKGRERLRMDSGWKFTLGDPPNAEKPVFDDHTWRNIDLPHDWSIEGPWSEDNPSGSAGGYSSLGIGWYRKLFLALDDFKGKRVYAEFDGVMNHADVWINGLKVDHNEYGYIGFECDLTPWLKFGKNNVLAVRVDNLKQASRWYTGSGIYRHVWLTVTDPVHVTHWGTYVTTPKVTGAAALVKIETTLENDSDAPAACHLTTRVLSPAGTPDGTSRSPAIIPPRAVLTVTQLIRVARPELWSLELPRLYRAVEEVRHDDKLTDTYQTPFGIRTLKFEVDHGFMLNGQRVVIKGVCLHHDLGALGAAAYEAGIERRLRILQGMGVNAVRLSHNPYSPEMLDLCDRLGILVFDEAFDKWYGFLPDGTGWKDDLKSFVQRDRNHPSVFIWSMGNEMTPHMYYPIGTRLYQAMSGFVHQYEPTRPVTAALHPVRNARGQRDAPLAALAQFMDVISMNYQAWFYPRDHRQHPSQVFLGSEIHPFQSNNLNKLGGSSDFSGNQWFGTQNYSTNKFFDYVAGQFVWAGFDYLGEAGPWPSKGSRHNLIDMAGFRKPFSYYWQSLYSNKPMVRIAVDNPAFYANPRKYGGANWNALSSHWNWPTSVKTLRVYTFTNAPGVELALNGKSLGEKSLKDYADRIISWDVPNQPGTLEAIAKEDGRPVATHEISTAGKAVGLALMPDRTHLDADGDNLAFVEVRLVDANGLVVPTAGTLVHFDISGPGTIVGVDNGDLDDAEPFESRQRETRRGRCLVIVKSTRESGNINLTARAGGFPEASVEFEAQSAPGIAALP